MQVRQVSDGQVLRLPLGYPADAAQCAFAPNGEVFIVVAATGVRVRRVNDDTLLRTLEGTPGRVDRPVAFSADSQTVAILSQQRVYLWNMQTDSPEHIINGLPVNVSYDAGLHE